MYEEHLKASIGLGSEAVVENVVINFATDGVDTIKSFDFGGGATANDNLQLTGNAGLLNANGANATTLIDAGGFAVAAIAADTSIGATATDTLLVAAEALTTITSASTATAIEAEAVVQLADGTDISANLNAANEGALVFMTNGTDYFLFELRDVAGDSVTDAGDVTLLGIFTGLDAANANTADFI